MTQLDAEQQIQSLKLKVSKLELELEKKEQDLNKLFYWINQFQSDVIAISNSLSWKVGDKLCSAAMKLMLKKTGDTAIDHLNQLITEISDWKPVSKTRNCLMIRDQFTSPKDYTKWVKNFDNKDNEQSIKKIIKSWKKKPLISIVLPVYNIEAKLLKKTLDSVRSQFYEYWELCIVDDASPEQHIKKILHQYADKDTRIKLHFRHINGHISAASNDALKLATGEYIALLDHDDTLANTALFWVVNEILTFPEVQIIYSDEDKVSMDDQRCDPYFKPDFNHDLLLSQNYMTHFAVYNANLLRTINGFRSEYDGAQDYDLVLRAVSQINEQFIRHIPRVLYHWRQVPGSTALDRKQKPYALKAAQNAVSDYLNVNGIDAEVIDTPEESGFIRVKYSLPENLPLVSIIIPTYNAYDILKQCIDSILEKTSYTNYEIIIINNNSDDSRTLDYLEVLSGSENIQILDYPYVFNFSKMNNYAVSRAKGNVICFLNNDTEVITPDWLEEMVSHLLRKNIAIVGARLWYPDNTLQHAGVTLGIAGIAGHTFKWLPKGESSYHNKAILIQNVSAVTAACMLIKIEDFINVGGFNEDKLHVAFNDIDLCLKIAQTGKKILWTPYAELYHHELVSRGYENTPEKISRLKEETNYMLSKWGEMLENDPFYNPNLTLKNESYSFAWPPRLKEIKSK